MKKILITLILLLVFALAAVYLFIPRKIKIEATVPLNAALPGVFRTLINDSSWEKWWPGETPFAYNKQAFSIKGKFFNVFAIDIYSDKDTINSRMELVPVEANTMTILWNAEQVSSNDPFKRFERYRHAKQIEKNSPMLNVFELGNSRYEAMTAIPVDKALPKTNEFAPKFLLKGGNILEVNIQGGPYAIEKGLKGLENYRADYKFDSPAIPYQLLVTDRAKEPDTTKWITRLYYPVF